MANLQTREVGLLVEDFYKDEGDYSNDREAAFELACSEEGMKAAKKAFRAEAKEAKVKIRKIESIDFIEFDSSNLSHACAYWLVTYQGKEFPEEE